MNEKELQYIKKNYFEDKTSLSLIFEMIEKVRGSLNERGEPTKGRDITLRLPIIRISEKSFVENCRQGWQFN